MSVNTALLRFIYPADQLGRGSGINALLRSTSAAIGPSVAAGILSIATWQWLFAINVPLVIVALVLARRALPRTPLARHRFDWLSALLSALTFGALIIGIDNLRRLTVGTPITVDVKHIGWRPPESIWMLLYDNNFTAWISHLLRANGSKCNHPEDSAF